MSWSKEYKESEIVKDYTKVLGKIWDSLMPSSYPLVLDFKTKRAVEVKKRKLVGPYHFEEVFIDYNCHAFIDNKPLLDLGWDGTNMTEEDVVKIYTNEYFSGMREHMRQLSKYAGLKFSNFDMGGKISITITDKQGFINWGIFIEKNQVISMNKSPYDIIRRLIELTVLPKYPFLKIKDIDSYVLTNNRVYDVRFITSKKLEPEVQMAIDTEVKNLFKMAGLDEKERYTRNKIAVWFKTPRAKDFSFFPSAGYDHI